MLYQIVPMGSFLQTGPEKRLVPVQGWQLLLERVGLDTFKNCERREVCMKSPS